MENSSSSAPFQKGSGLSEYPVDVGFGNIYPLFETPENRLADTRGFLARWRHEAGEHEQMLVSGPESFLAT